MERNQAQNHTQLNVEEEKSLTKFVEVVAIATRYWIWENGKTDKSNP